MPTRFARLPVISIFYDALVAYPAPTNLSMSWNYGIYSLVVLAIQILTGILLSMHYCADTNLAFISVEHIMRDVSGGWLFRYIHGNGASMFFIVVFLHTFRGLYYGSFTYPRQFLWIIGVLILVLMIVTAFMGYVLPWGQMSFWGATVITNLFSAIPFIGTDIVLWLWGGFAVDNPTLGRFYSLHFTLPFVILALAGIHIYALHLTGSNNPLGLSFAPDSNTFAPFYLIKDAFGLTLFLIFFSLFLFFAPNLLGHPDNYTLGNPMITPTHIVPEWYFLPFYAILRSIPDKLAGVLALAASIVCLFSIPFIHKPQVRSLRFRPFSRVVFWGFVLVCCLLGWLGAKPIEAPFILLGGFTTTLYFTFLLVLFPLVIQLEKNITSLSFKNTC